MSTDFVLYLANDDTVRIDALDGCLLIPPGADSFRVLAEQHGYECCPADDERHGQAIRRAYDAICENETEKEF